ncbi:MAG: sugar kinase [Treponema sp.]|jgi:2-dehydro-3-deoxygluconokinase|nr:sugar kinase [Treponema sp.]
MGKIITFGEIMLRLAPEGYYRFVQASSFGASFGGGEANVAVSLAGFGMDAAFVSKLPAHEIGQAAVNKLREFGVDTSFIVRGGRRVGIYFLEKGASQRPSKVIYDRAHSSIAEASASDFDWKKIFSPEASAETPETSGASWFHFTGITPALSDAAAEITAEACRAAKAAGFGVSCDLNYRKNLWPREKAGKTMEALMKYVDVCIANEEDAEQVFGIHAAGSDVASGKISRAGYEQAAKILTERFGFAKTAITLRESVSASDNNWGAMLYDNGTAYFSKQYAVRIVDRVGGGDSFAAGLVYGILNSMAPQENIEFAAAASCLKHSVEGDFNHVSVEEVKKLAKGDASGRVQR